MQRLLILVSIAAGVFLAPATVRPFTRIDPGASAAVIERLPPADRARAWLEEHRAGLAALVRTPQGKAAIRTRIEVWHDAGLYLAANGGRTEESKGFIIYPPEASLSLFLLARAEVMYRAALEQGWRAVPQVEDLFRIGTEPLTTTSPDKYPSAARAEAALASLALPSGALRGYRVFLLPFVMGAVSGLGGPGFAFVAAEPRHANLIPNQLEVTLVHEFGHYLHLAGMPRETREGRRKWGDYLRARKLTWRDDGGVNTAAWANSPEETFAEDFRLLFGARAAEEPAATAAGDPRADARLARRLKRFMVSLAAETRPPEGLVPWPEGESMTARSGVARAVLGLLPLGVLAGFGLGYRPRRRAMGRP
ncbi:MAG: hypothetical protein ACM3ZC_13905 [Bacteroidota bacterium]